MFIGLRSIPGEYAMRVRLLIGFLVTAVVAAGSVALAVNSTKVAGTKTVKEVMKIAHKDGLHKKILGGMGTDDDKKQLLDLYLDLVEGEPKKGDKAEFKVQASAAMASAARVMLGREGAIDELKKTSDCKSCHDKFK